MKRQTHLSLIASFLILSACGGDSGGGRTFYDISGSVSGYDGIGLTLKNTADSETPPQIITSNSTYTFPQGVSAPGYAPGTAYSLSITQQPVFPNNSDTPRATQTCTFDSNHSTTLSGTFNNNVYASISCVTNPQISIVINGDNDLAGNLAVTEDGGTAISIPAGSTSKTLNAAVGVGDMWDVEIATLPTDPVQSCSFDPASPHSGIVPAGGAQQITVSVICSAPNYLVKAVVTGLNGSGLVLQDTVNGQPVNVVANGSVTLDSGGLSVGSSYNVAVVSSPASPLQGCTAANANGTITNGDAIVVVHCTGEYAISGVVSGLTENNYKNLVLQLTSDGNPPENVTLNVSGNFSFSTKVKSGSNYQVSVLTEPNLSNAQFSMPSRAVYCSVLNVGAKGIVNGPITNVGVSCIALPQYVSFTGFDPSSGAGVYALASVDTSGALTSNQAVTTVAGADIVLASDYGGFTTASGPTSSPGAYNSSTPGVTFTAPGTISALYTDQLNCRLFVLYQDAITSTQQDLAIYSTSGTPDLTIPNIGNGNIQVGSVVLPGSPPYQGHGEYVYVATSNALYAFSSTCSAPLHALNGGQPYTIGANPGPITSDASGDTLIVIDGSRFANGSTDSGIWAFSISNTDGTLSPLPGSPYAIPGNGTQGQFYVPTAAVFDPLSTNLYVLATTYLTGSGHFSAGYTSIFQYTFNSISGLVALPNPTTLLSGASYQLQTFFIDPSGSYLYAGPTGGGAPASTTGLFMVPITAAGGALQTPQNLTLGTASTSGSLLTPDPSGKFLFVSDGTLEYTYTSNGNGTFSSNPTSTFNPNFPQYGVDSVTLSYDSYLGVP